MGRLDCCVTPAAKKFRALGSEALLRLREIDFRAAKNKAAEMAARSAAVWSRVSLRRSHSSDKQSTATVANERWWRAIAGAGCGVSDALRCPLFLGLRDIPWEEIAEGSLKPVVLLKQSMASRW